MRRTRPAQPPKASQFKPGEQPSHLEAYAHIPKRVPRDVVAKRLAFVEGCLTLGMSNHQTAVQARKAPPEGLGIGRSATLRLISRVRERWAGEWESNRHQFKVDAVNRLMASMRAARQEKKWSAVLGFERLIADIQGTREPLRVDVNVNMNAAIMHVIGSLTGEQRDGLLEEYQALEERAKLADAAHPLLTG